MDEETEAPLDQPEVAQDEEAEEEAHLGDAGRYSRVSG